MMTAIDPVYYAAIFGKSPVFRRSNYYLARVIRLKYRMPFETTIGQNQLRTKTSP